MKKKMSIRIISICCMVIGVICLAVGGMAKMGLLNEYFPSATTKVYDWSEMDLSKDHTTEAEDNTESGESQAATQETESEAETVTVESETENEEGGATDETQN